MIVALSQLVKIIPDDVYHFVEVLANACSDDSSYNVKGHTIFEDDQLSFDIDPYPENLAKELAIRGNKDSFRFSPEVEANLTSLVSRFSLNFSHDLIVLLFRVAEWSSVDLYQKIRYFVRALLSQVISGGITVQKEGSPSFISSDISFLGKINKNIANLPPTLKGKAIIFVDSDTFGGKEGIINGQGFSITFGKEGFELRLLPSATLCELLLSCLK